MLLKGRTNGRSEALLHHRDELMVDVDGEIAQDLSVLGQVKVLQAVLLLARRALLQELLFEEERNPVKTASAGRGPSGMRRADAPPRRCTASGS